MQHERVVSNDYAVRFENRWYQLGKPIYPGERRGRVVIELRLDGTMAIRFRGRYLNWQEIARGSLTWGPAPRPPEFTASAADASGAKRKAGPRVRRAGPLAYSRPAGARVALLRSPIPLLCTTGVGYNSRARPDMERPA